MESLKDKDFPPPDFPSEIEEFSFPVKRDQDYADVLFGLSRINTADVLNGDNRLVVRVERAWCGDVANYITELENIILSELEAGDE